MRKVATAISSQFDIGVRLKLDLAGEQILSCYKTTLDAIQQTHKYTERRKIREAYRTVADFGLPLLEDDENARWALRLTAAVSLRKMRSNSSG
jgi:hypothetical protein